MNPLAWIRKPSWKSNGRYSVSALHGLLHNQAKNSLRHTGVGGRSPLEASLLPVPCCPQSVPPHFPGQLSPLLAVPLVEQEVLGCALHQGRHPDCYPLPTPPCFFDQLSPLLRASPLLSTRANMLIAALHKGCYVSLHQHLTCCHFWLPGDDPDPELHQG